MKSFDELLEELKKDKELGHYDIEMVFNKYHVALLAQQKRSLVTIMSMTSFPEERNDIEPILLLIDAVQDSLADKHGFPSEVVFPFACDACDEPEPVIINYRAALEALLAAAHEDLPKYLNLNPDLDKVLKKYFNKGEI